MKRRLHEPNEHLSRLGQNRHPADVHGCLVLRVAEHVVVSLVGAGDQGDAVPRLHVELGAVGGGEQDTERLPEVALVHDAAVAVRLAAVDGAIGDVRDEGGAHVDVVNDAVDGPFDVLLALAALDQCPQRVGG